jgi:eukaryotic-like serine/threonine-protein kinase
MRKAYAFRANSMAAPASIDDLTKLIRKSGMVDDPRLDAYLNKLRATGTATNDVKKMAGNMVKDGLLTYFQAEQFLLGKWRGFTIGKYKLLERIGFGGMGQVFLCEHLYMRRRVAIKVLPPAKAEEPAALGRFYREARAAAALDHPNIVRTHDIDQDGNLHFLVMEYVDGSSLLDIIKKTGPMDVKRATNYVAQSLQGLDHAFRVGVIHRDIKPGNILVDRSGSSKILDMGLARFYHTDDDMLTLKYDEKSVLGTADYVAPEQTVNSHEVDVRADIYSLGATFYYLLAGHPPYPEGTIAQKLIAHQTREPTPIRQIRPEVPEGLAAVVKKMLARQREERYQTPEEVFESLQPFMAPIPAPPEHEMPQLSLAARDQSGAPPSSLSGSMRQDGGQMRADLTQRSDRLTAGSKGSRSGGPVATAPPAPPPSSSRTGGSSPVRGPYPEAPVRGHYPEAPPPGNPLPASSTPNAETKRMSNRTDRTPMSEQRNQPNEEPEKKGLFSSPVARIVAEAILVFGIALGAWWAWTRYVG